MSQYIIINKMKKALINLVLAASVNSIAIDSSIYSKTLDNKSIKQVLEKNKQENGVVNAEVFYELLTRSDIPHVLMSETK